ncbi:MAG: sugar nucleotide-binding protein, partial [Deltaproteobacteria bacterium]|nr:sugar nucleotide-binding protein [Deltaproteobacteria bacterium]
MKSTVIVLGATGMLGSMVLDVLSREPSLSLAATVRRSDQAEKLNRRLPGVEVKLLDAFNDQSRDIADVIDGNSWVVNAIGTIKPYIHDDNATEVEAAILVNALFPHKLAAAAEKVGASVLQIATDCVYAGDQGHYPEGAPHDPVDVYGKTKSLGEVCSKQVHHLRCSIVGPEPKADTSLLGWFLGQPSGSRNNGYTNH